MSKYFKRKPYDGELEEVRKSIDKLSADEKNDVVMRLFSDDLHCMSHSLSVVMIETMTNVDFKKYDLDTLAKAFSYSIFVSTIMESITDDIIDAVRIHGSKGEIKKFQELTKKYKRDVMPVLNCDDECDCKESCDDAEDDIPDCIIVSGPGTLAIATRKERTKQPVESFKTKTGEEYRILE